MIIGNEMQDILSMIHRNQAQIDLLTSNNTQLVSYLLRTGMMQNVQELRMGHPMAPQQLPSGLPFGNGSFPMFQQEAPKRRGRPPKAMLEAMTPKPTPKVIETVAEPVAAQPKKTKTKKTNKRVNYIPSRKEGDLLQSEYLLKFAQENGGKLMIQEFRDAKHSQDFAPSFFETTIYGILQKLVKIGKMKKIGVGHYELGKKAAKAA